MSTEQQDEPVRNTLSALEVENLRHLASSVLDGWSNHRELLRAASLTWPVLDSSQPRGALLPRSQETLERPIKRHRVTDVLAGVTPLPDGSLPLPTVQGVSPAKMKKIAEQPTYTPCKECAKCVENASDTQRTLASALYWCEARVALGEWDASLGPVTNDVFSTLCLQALANTRKEKLLGLKCGLCKTCREAAHKKCLATESLRDNMVPQRFTALVPMSLNEWLEEKRCQEECEDRNMVRQHLDYETMDESLVSSVNVFMANNDDIDFSDDDDEIDWAPWLGWLGEGAESAGGMQDAVRCTLLAQSLTKLKGAALNFVEDQACLLPSKSREIVAAADPPAPVRNLEHSEEWEEEHLRLLSWADWNCAQPDDWPPVTDSHVGILGGKIVHVIWKLLDGLLQSASGVPYNGCSDVRTSKRKKRGNAETRQCGTFVGLPPLPCTLQAPIDVSPTDKGHYPVEGGMLSGLPSDVAMIFNAAKKVGLPEGTIKRALDRYVTCMEAQNFTST